MSRNSENRGRNGHVLVWEQTGLDEDERERKRKRGMCHAVEPFHRVRRRDAVIADPSILFAERVNRNGTRKLSCSRLLVTFSPLTKIRNFIER